IRNPGNRVHVDSFLHLEFDRKMAGRILRVGVPNGTENGMFHFGKIIVSGMVASMGTTSITANAVSNSLAAVTNIPGMAIGLAMVTVIGQCVGAGEYTQAKRYTIRLQAVACL